MNSLTHSFLKCTALHKRHGDAVVYIVNVTASYVHTSSHTDYTDHTKVMPPPPPSRPAIVQTRGQTDYPSVSATHLHVLHASVIANGRTPALPSPPPPLAPAQTTTSTMTAVDAP